MQRSIIAMALSLGLFQEAGAEVSSGGSNSKRAKPEVQKVKMQDGREVEFVGKRKLLKETLIDGGKVSVRLDFRNGETRLFPIPDGLILRAAGHGIEQKLGDETAGEEDVDDMNLAVDELIERLSSGDPDSWITKREGGGMSGTSTLLKALVELSGKGVEEIKAFLKPLSQAEKMALRQSPKVKPIVDRIEAEKATKAANVDTGALLAQLGG